MAEGSSDAVWFGARGCEVLDVEMVGFDKTVMYPAHRRRRRRFVTAVVDVATGQIFDVFEGHDAADLRAWMAEMPASWLEAIEAVSVDPQERYRAARSPTRTRPPAWPRRWPT